MFYLYIPISVLHMVNPFGVCIEKGNIIIKTMRTKLEAHNMAYTVPNRTDPLVVKIARGTINP